MRYLFTFFIYLAFYSLIAFALNETKSVWALLFLLATPTFKLKIDEDEDDGIERDG